MTADEMEVLRDLMTQADADFGGHLTVLRFMTNWRFGFGTPAERDDIAKLAEGRTLAEAGRAALRDPQKFNAYPD